MGITAFIGGTGLYSGNMPEKTETHDVKTEYGMPSSTIVKGVLGGKEVAFLFRHGSPSHTIPPHAINFKANMRALKDIGAERIIGTAAVGSLRKEIAPGDVVVPDSFIDLGRDVITYHDGPEVMHVEMADPFCPELRASLISCAKGMGGRFHEKGTYIRVHGPRFSTRAESRMFRQFADVIGMTCIPEAILARELGMCYASVAMVSDYDVWSERAVNANTVKETMKKNAVRLNRIISAVAGAIPEERGCECEGMPDRGKF